MPHLIKPIDELDGANFDSHALKSDLPIVIDFWAEWCGACRMMTPDFGMAAPRLEPRVRLGKLDTEAEPAIAGRYGIRGIPSMVMLRKGREITRTSGRCRRRRSSTGSRRRFGGPP